MGQVLVASICDDRRSAQLHARHLGDGADHLVEAATFHGVEAFVHRALGEDERVPQTIRDVLLGEYYRVVLTRRQVLADLAVVCDTLDTAGIDFVVLKGPSLAERLYPDAALR